MLISNSEVECFNTCEKRYYYAFSLGLQPVEEKETIDYGTLGHEALQQYYFAKKARLPHRRCIEAGVDFILDVMKNRKDEYSNKVKGIVTDRFFNYIQYYEHDPWEVIDVEGVYTVPLDNGTEYALTLDLLVEVTSGPFRGEQIVMDHKWVYNFMTQDELKVNVQLPKYIWAMRKLGSNVKRGIINEIRFRQMKGEPKDLFRRDWFNKPQVYLDNVMAEHQKAANTIVLFKEDPIEVQKHVAQRNLSRMTCRDCAFRSPCMLELEDKDPTVNLAVNYGPRQYGYSEEKIRGLRTLQ